MILELQCGCQVSVSNDLARWAMARRCKRVKTVSKDRVAIERDHYHEIEARIHEVRGTVQGQ